MFLLLAMFGVVAIVLRPLVRVAGLSVFRIAAVVPLAAFVHAVVAGGAVLGGGTVEERMRWIPELQLALSLRLDVLSWVLALVVTGVGTLVLLYCPRYFSRDEDGLGRFAAFFLAFAGAMYGLVLADDVFLLFIFWEATTVFSYLLIGHSTGRKASRGAALQALLVTTAGGLVMLVGFVLLVVHTGTASLSEIVDAAPTGTLPTVAILLVLVGAVSKSAIAPFHFWLPAAMAAPTPVSAYLHAAAMVKAGIYLLLRLAPGFAESPGWRSVLVALGVVTMLLGAYRSLRQHDLKLLLAYGTVSQLGFLTVVAGYGTRDVGLAALALLLAHALFKAALFLVVGVVDHQTGTRDLRKLSDLGRSAPVLAAVAIVAAASMAGLPPTLGFVAKEAVFTSLLTDALAGAPLGWVALVGVAIGSALTVAYTLRFLWGAFARKPEVQRTEPAHRDPLFVVVPALLAVGGLVFGPLAFVVDGWVQGYSGALPVFSDAARHGGAPPEAYHLALWHGLEPALGISALVIAAGIGLHVSRRRVGAMQDAAPAMPRASEGYWLTLRGIDQAAVRITSVTQTGSLPRYLGVILLVLIGSVGAALALVRDWPLSIVAWDSPGQLTFALLMIIASIAATVASRRFQAALLVGVTGFGMSGVFAIHGAPDLALTQLLVEAVTLVAFVLVLRRLPARLGTKHGSTRRKVRAVLAALVGLVMMVVAALALGSRIANPISGALPRLAVEGGHGTNVVNVILVDIRGWDTMGELSVVLAAATGVASLIFLRSRVDEAERPLRSRRRIRDRLSRDRTPAPAGPAWLIAGDLVDPRERSIILEVAVRLIFHSIIVVSVYLLFAGHNAPGGGFAGGLVAGLALVARYLAGGRLELGAATPVDAGKVLGAGLLIATGTAAVPLLFGADALTSTWWEAEVWLFGHVEFVTSTIFDIGVYLVVVGLVLDVLRSLGAELDRQVERRGAPTGGVVT
ncbi:Na+/H+ antiporter subunit A [Lysobacter korlensis]|uniref:Na+/H+ antiporter subunit A n=1 Tax=Lysobacter korlensis TaxID=553636 RepID=A0ABV6RXZ8_9GAMM